jgi:hypothetical protein
MFAQQKTEFCPKQNQNMDNKFDAEANHRISDSKFPNKAAATLILKQHSSKKNSLVKPNLLLKALKLKTRPEKNIVFS